MKLDIQHKHIMRLINRDAKQDGWTDISDQLYPVLLKSMPNELIEFNQVSGKGKARLTDEGKSVLSAIDNWLS